MWLGKLNLLLGLKSPFNPLTVVHYESKGVVKGVAVTAPIILKKKLMNKT